MTEGSKGAAGAAVVLALIACLYPWLQRWQLSRTPELFRPYEVTVTPDALVAWRVDDARELGSYRWEIVQEIAATPERYFVYWGEYTALILPRRAFPSQESEAGFVAAIQAARNAAGAVRTSNGGGEP